MAKFNSEYAYKAMDIKKFYRLPLAFKENHFFVNFGMNSIAKMQDKKMLHNWTLKHPHFFTSPIVCLESENKLCCISNNVVLYVWSLEDDTLQDATKVKFKEEIFGVVCASKEKAFLIFNSGKWLNFKDAISNESPSEYSMLTAEEELVWIDAALFKSEIVLVYIAFLRKEKEYKLFTIFLNETTYAMERSDSRFIKYEEKTLKCWCLNKRKEDCSFLTLWANGAIINHNIDKNTYSSLFSVNIQDHHILAMEVIEWPHMAILKVDNKEDSVLEIWDAKFSALKTQKILKLTNCNYIQLSIIGKEIFFYSNDSLIKVPFLLKKSTLAAAIGKSTTSFPKPKEYKWDAKKGMIPLPSSSRIEQDSELGIQDKIQKLIKEGDTSIYYFKEHELIELLSLVIKSQEDNAYFTENDCNIILNFIFSASYTDVFLMKQLKKLTLDEVLHALKLVANFLLYPDKRINVNKPSDLQILSWLCLIIQSHYQIFILRNVQVPYKEEIKKFLYDKIEYYELINEISVYLCLLKKENILPERNIQENYCTEILDL